MATSEIQIANMALRNVAVRRVVGAFTDPNPEAETCSLFYSQTRNALLEEFDWNFARRRSVLTELEDEENSEWTYCYGLPEDIIVPRYIVTPGARTPSVSSPRIPFDQELEADGETLMLVTDATEPELVYTAEIDNPLLFTPLFVDALSWRLAMALCIPLSVKPEMATMIERKSIDSINRAIAARQAQRVEDVMPDSEFIAVRS